MAAILFPTSVRTPGLHGIVSVQFQKALACASSQFCCISSISARAWSSSSLSFWSCFRSSLSTLLCPLVFRRSRRVLPSCIILALFWRFLCISWFKCSTSLSRLTPMHPSRQRSLSICPGASSFSTYHVSFDWLPPRPRIANGSWVWNSNPFLTIRYASLGHGTFQNRTLLSHF